MLLVQWFEPLIIIGIVLFLAFVVFLVIFSKKKGKSITSDCAGDCQKCGGQCKINLLDEYNKSKSMNRYVYYIEGMHCEMCVELIRRSIANLLENVRDIKVSFKKSCLEFTYDGFLDVKKPKEEIEKLGYRVIGIVRK